MKLLLLHAARALALVMALTGAGALSGCATLPDEGPRVITTALQPRGESTPLDRTATASMTGADPGASGFRLMLGLAGMDRSEERRVGKECA